MAVPKIIITRQVFDCPIFGTPKDLPLNKLPTGEDVLRCLSHERYNLALKINNKSVSFSQVANTVANKVISLYKKASIPTVSDKRIVQLLNALHDKYYGLRKSHSRDKNKESFIKKLNEFKYKCSLLFDVAACKCPIVLNCNCSKTPDLCQCSCIITCICEKSNKIPSIELKFVYSLRVHGIGKIGGVDLSETKKRIKSLARKSRIGTSNQNSEIKVFETEQQDSEDNISLCSPTKKDDCSDSDQEFIPELPKQKSSSWQMRINLKSTALVSDRYGVSDRATAAIASSVLHDIGIVTSCDHSKVVDKCKIRREKHNIRADLSSSITENTLQGLYFDGRKDDTIVVEMAHSKRFLRVLKEEHYSLIQEPGNIFLGHVTPNSGSSEDIVTSFISYLSSNDISLEELVVIGCDGTAVNTGLRNGIIRRIELHLGKPLQWAVCLLHFNELPFRHLFQYLDGKSTGPNSLKGPIGEKLNKCETLPVVQFKSINCQIPEIDSKLLSKDQKYLLDISLAIKSGKCEEDLAIRDPGPLSHSRWLTTANRTLRLYISQENPSAEFQEIVMYILNSYMPMWFSIKKTKLFTDGPKLIYQSVKTSRYLTDELKAIVDPVIDRNGFFAHPEHVMITMTQDPRKHIRELGLRRIIKARERDQKRKKIRTYVAPKLNFSATDYTELIDWQNCELSSPPLLKDVTDEEIKDYIKTEQVPKWDILSKKLPVHTQAVERCVKLVTKASSKVCGAEARDGFIRTTIKSRSTMPAFDNKSHFKLPDM